MLAIWRRRFVSGSVSFENDAVFNASDNWMGRFLVDN
jgi:hypothetical protein